MKCGIAHSCLPFETLGLCFVGLVELLIGLVVTRNGLRALESLYFLLSSMLAGFVGAVGFCSSA